MVDDEVEATLNGQNVILSLVDLVDKAGNTKISIADIFIDDGQNSVFFQRIIHFLFLHIHLLNLDPFLMLDVMAQKISFS